MGLMRWIGNNIKGMWRLGRHVIPNWLDRKTGKASRPVRAAVGLGIGGALSWFWTVPALLTSVAAISAVAVTAMSTLAFPPVAILLPVLLKVALLPFSIAFTAGTLGLVAGGKDAVLPGGLRNSPSEAKFRRGVRRYQRQQRRAQKGLQPKKGLGNIFRRKAKKEPPRGNENPGNNGPQPPKPPQGGWWID